MKKTVVSWAVALIALFVFRCSEDIDPHSVTADLHLQDPELYDYLNCQGFDLTDAKLFDEHVVVEGDIVIRRDAIREYIWQQERENSTGRTGQHVVNTNAVVSFVNVLDMTFFIGSSVGPINGDWESAIRTATQNWEDISNCRISFTEVFSAAAADIDFYADNDASLPACARNLDLNWYALAEFSGAGQPGTWISINDSDLSDTQGNRETVIRHELGHALGFRHNNAPGIGELTNSVECGNDIFGANLLSKTPANDGASVMVNAIYESTSINLSTYDKQAARFMYPSSPSTPTISTISQYYVSPSLRDVSVNMTNPSVRMYRYRVERCPPWSITPVQTEEYTSGDNTLWLHDVPLGTWNFRITGLNYARDVSLTGLPTTKTIN